MSTTALAGSRAPRRSTRRALLTALAVALALVWAFPVYWMLNSAFLDKVTLQRTTPTFLPFGGSFDNFRAIFTQSSVVGVRKPEEAFYKLALDALDVSAEECVYLDDLGVNLKPARAMGMTTVKVVDADEAVAELERHLDLPLR